MEERKIAWCFKLKDGIKIVEPNEFLSNQYLEQANLSLIRASQNFEDQDFLWATIVVYYAEYYALYSFLQKIGITSENHLCSILLALELTGNSKLNTIYKHRQLRLDAQYYMKIKLKQEISKILLEAKVLVAYFLSYNSRLTFDDIACLRSKALKMSEVKLEKYNA